MTEEEWLTSNRPDLMIASLQRTTKLLQIKRKLRLFVCACCRWVSPPAPDEDFERIVVASELYSDDQLGIEDFNRIRTLVPAGVVSRHRYLWHRDLSAIALCPKQHLWDATNRAISQSVTVGLELRFGREYWSNEQWRIVRDELRVPLASIVRDIFGNPFRPVSFSPDWRTSTTVAIAQGMYELRDFSPMPLLADALQDAGCEVSEIIDHCRGPGPHVRGCWVVDGVLGKT
jgi:hypothetical protein